MCDLVATWTWKTGDTVCRDRLGGYWNNQYERCINQNSSHGIREEWIKQRGFRGRRHDRCPADVGCKGERWNDPRDDSHFHFRSWIWELLRGLYREEASLGTRGEINLGSLLNSSIWPLFKYPHKTVKWAVGNRGLERRQKKRVDRLYYF